MSLVELSYKDKIKTVSRYWLHLLKHYFRVEVEGIENIPKSGGAVIVANHSGFAGADAVLLTFVIKRETRRRARLLAHRAYFDYSKTLKAISESHGLKRASIASGVETLKKKQLLIVFPEGEAGNFKSSYKRYELQAFHSGYLRMAGEAKVPIVPCLIVGAEESHLSLGSLDFSDTIKNFRIPLPLNLMPLPAKWKIVFLPAIKPEQYSSQIRGEKAQLKREISKLQKRMQGEIDLLREKRKYIYSSPTRRFADRILKVVEKILSP